MSINVKGAYSFIDIKESFMTDVLDSFEDESYKGRKIRVDGSGGGGKKGGGTKTHRPYSPSGGKKRFFKKTSWRK